MGAQTATIGIIGSGAAGAFAAHFLRAAFGERVRTAVFERNGRVGGRTRLIEVGGVPVEAGAKAVHSSNRYMNQAIEAFGARGAVFDPASETRREGFGIWNGTSFDFVMDRPLGELPGHLLQHFGEDAVITAHRLVSGMVESLCAVYQRQQRDEAWETPEEMLRALGLYELTQTDGYSYLRGSGVDEAFVLQMSDGITRANYGQTSGINAFAALVSLAGGGFGGGLAVSAACGNENMFRHMIENSGAHLFTGWDVAAIEAGRDPEAAREGAADEKSYVVRARDGRSLACDAVVIATPLELAKLEFRGVAVPDEALSERAFQTTHATFVRGRLNPAYFGLPPGTKAPALILTREHPAAWFSSIGLSAGPADGVGVFKVFSREALSDDQLDQLFAERGETVRIVWQAYPVLKPMAVWPPFRLAPGLYYVNAMESAVSTMETQAIAARNVVNLMAREMWV